MWVTHPLEGSQLGQLSLSSLWGRQMSSKQHLYGLLLVAAVVPSGECLRNKGRHGLMEDVDGSSLPADTQPKLVDVVTWSVGWQPIWR